MAAEASYVLAAGRASLTRLYDPVMDLAMRERTVRPRVHRLLLDDLPEGAVVVDIGAGTGRSAIGLADERPDATVIGVDGDPDVLAIAQGKAGARRVRWVEGFADALPVEEREADRALLSLVLHHLTATGKRRALGEAFRVLRPGGRLIIADWGPPRGVGPRLGFSLLRALDGRENTAAHAAGLIPNLVQGAGFAVARSGVRTPTPFGTLELLSATRPGT